MTRYFLPPETFVGRLLPGLIEERRCVELIAQLTARGFAATGERYPADYRNNDRLVFDDARLAAELAQHLQGRLPDELVEHGARWKLVGLNTRFRACRYENGQAFCIHRDGAHVPEDDHRSFLTVQLYLDDDPARVGGRTRFYADPRGRERWAEIAPSRGSVIVFDHRVWHDGEPVTSGKKHVLRTDAMYRRIDGERLVDEPDVIGRHRGYAWSVICCSDGTLASSGRDGTVRRWRDGSVIDPGRGSVTTLVEGEDGVLWYGTRSGVIAPLADGEAIATDTGAVLDSARSARLVAFTTANGAVITPAWTAHVHDGWAWGITHHLDGFATCGHDGRIVLLDRAGRSSTLATVDVPLRTIVSHGDRIEVGDDRGWIHTINREGDVVALRRAHASPVTALAYALDGSLLSAGEDGTVKRWRGGHATLLRELRDHVTSVAITGNTAIVAGYDGAIRRIELQDLCVAAPNHTCDRFFSA